LEFAWQHPGGLAHVNPLLNLSCREAGHCQACLQAGEEASPDHGDSRDRSTAEPILCAGVHCSDRVQLGGGGGRQGQAAPATFSRK
jgi:hypothetical protein